MCTERKVTILELFLEICGLAGNKLHRKKEADMKEKSGQKIGNLLSGLHNQKSDFAFVCFLDVLVYF